VTVSVCLCLCVYINVYEVNEGIFRLWTQGGDGVLLLRLCVSSSRGKRADPAVQRANENNAFLFFPTALALSHTHTHAHTHSPPTPFFPPSAHTQNPDGSRTVYDYRAELHEDAVLLDELPGLAAVDCSASRSDWVLSFDSGRGTPAFVCGQRT